MKTISDLIEDFILEQLTDNQISLSRNELANYFNCAPSQINYVLATRFNHYNGFDVVSRRGGGGYIKIVRYESTSKVNFIKNVISTYLVKSIDFNNACLLLQNLHNNNILSLQECQVLEVALSNKSLASPIKNESSLRAKILANVLINKIKEV